MKASSPEAGEEGPFGGSTPPYQRSNPRGLTWDAEEAQEEAQKDEIDRRAIFGPG